MNVNYCFPDLLSSKNNLDSLVFRQSSLKKLGNYLIVNQVNCLTPTLSTSGEGGENIEIKHVKIHDSHSRRRGLHFKKDNESRA